MEFPQDYFGSAAERSQLAARRLVLLRDGRKVLQPPYHPYAHEQWRSRLHATNQQPNEQHNGGHVNHQEKRFVPMPPTPTPTPTGHVGRPPASPAVPLSSSYRRILLLGPSPSSNASDRLVSPQNRNNYYVDVGREAPPPQYFRREVVRRDNDRERVTVNFLGAMASRMEMLPRTAKVDVDDGAEKSKHAGLDVSLHL